MPPMREFQSWEFQYFERKIENMEKDIVIENIGEEMVSGFTKTIRNVLMTMIISGAIVIKGSAKGSISICRGDGVIFVALLCCLGMTMFFTSFYVAYMKKNRMFRLSKRLQSKLQSTSSSLHRSMPLNLRVDSYWKSVIVLFAVGLVICFSFPLVIYKAKCGSGNAYEILKESYESDLI